MRPTKDVMAYSSKSLAIRLLNRLGSPLMAAGFAPRIDGERILAKAQRAHGAPTKLEPLSAEGLNVRAQAYDTEARLSLFGRLIVQRDLIRCATNQLAFERAYQQHPEILQERIEKPLFIVGLPRSGTTLMQRLMCCHAGARYLPFWEVHEPVPRNVTPSPEDTRRRMRAGRNAVWQLNTVVPDLRGVHAITAETDPEECLYLFLYTQLLPDGFDFANLPTYWRWLDNLPDRTAPHQMLARQLKLLQWVRRGQHWVLKSPVHSARLPELLEVFPDARIVFMERDPMQSVASLCSLTALMWSVLSEDVDLNEVGAYVLDVAEQSRRVTGQALRNLGPDRLARVAYSELVKDPIGVAAGLYERFGYDGDPRLEASMRNFMAANPRNKHPHHNYHLGDFGLDVETVRARLAPWGIPSAISDGSPQFAI